MYQSLFSTELAIGTRYDTAVILGWYPLSVFVKNYDSSLYGVAGNLFNPNFGVKLLIRNLFYNNHIKNLVLCSITKEDKTNRPCDALEDTLCKELHSKLGKHLRIFFVNSTEGLTQTLINISRNNLDLTPIRESVLLPPIDVERSIVSGNIYSQNITKKTIKKAFPEVIKQIRNHGRLIADIQEYSNLNICITDEATDIDTLMGSVEDNEKPVVQQYINDFMLGTNSEHSYSYGDRLIEGNQVENVITKLKEKPLTMSAVMVLYHPQDLIKGNSPCLTQIWVRGTANNKLEMTATFRSNDMYRAWFYNVYALRALQISIANRLNLTASILTTVSFSAHIYQKDFEEIETFLNYLQKSKDRKKKSEYYSVVGNFVITYRNETVYIQQMTNTGELSLNWEIFNPNSIKVDEIMKDICEVNPSIEREHILYIYRELYKVYRHKENYKQL